MEAGLPFGARILSEHGTRTDGRPERSRWTAAGRRPRSLGHHGRLGVRVAVRQTLHRRVQNATGVGHVFDVRTAQRFQIVLVQLHRLAAHDHDKCRVLHDRKSTRRFVRKGFGSPTHNIYHVLSDYGRNVVGRLLSLF